MIYIHLNLFINNLICIMYNLEYILRRINNYLFLQKLCFSYKFMNLFMLLSFFNSINIKNKKYLYINKLVFNKLKKSCW